MTGRTRGPGGAPDPHGFELEADLIRVLANPKRLMIVGLLGESSHTVTEIARRLELTLQNTSQHLRLMRNQRIVRAHREGREIRYELTSPVFSEACQLVRQALLAEARARPVHLGWITEAGFGGRRALEGAAPRGRPAVAAPS